MSNRVSRWWYLGLILGVCKGVPVEGCKQGSLYGVLGVVIGYVVGSVDNTWRKGSAIKRSLLVGEVVNISCSEVASGEAEMALWEGYGLVDGLWSSTLVDRAGMKAEMYYEGIDDVLGGVLGNITFVGELCSGGGGTMMPTSVPIRAPTLAEIIVLDVPIPLYERKFLFVILLIGGYVLMVSCMVGCVGCGCKRGWFGERYKVSSQRCTDECCGRCCNDCCCRIFCCSCRYCCCLKNCNRCDKFWNIVSCGRCTALCLCVCKRTPRCCKQFLCVERCERRDD